MTQRKKDSLLWQISPLEGGPVSYLFGTMHIRDLRAFTWWELARAHLAQCEVFAAEFDFSQADPNAMAAAWALPEQTSLEQMLSRRAWKNLAYHTQKKLGVSVETFRHAHPMQVQTALTTSLLREEMPQSLDETLWAYAAAQGKAMTGLETFAEQVEILHRIPLEDHLKSLTHFIKNYNRQRERLKKMLRWYQQGNICQLYRASRRDARWMRRTLLLERNERLARRFADIAHHQSLFAAVGAAHLAGGKGMLRLIKRLGFSVNPIVQHAP